MKGRILQLNTSIPLKCGTGCLFIKLTLGRVGMGRVLHLGPSWHGPSWHGPSCPAPGGGYLTPARSLGMAGHHTVPDFVDAGWQWCPGGAIFPWWSGLSP